MRQQEDAHQQSIVHVPGVERHLQPGGARRVLDARRGAVHRSVHAQVLEAELAARVEDHLEGVRRSVLEVRHVRVEEHEPRAVGVGQGMASGNREVEVVPEGRHQARRHGGAVVRQRLVQVEVARPGEREEPVRTDVHRRERAAVEREFEAEGDAGHGLVVAVERTVVPIPVMSIHAKDGPPGSSLSTQR
jgi:hypothetical protein